MPVTRDDDNNNNNNNNNSVSNVKNVFIVAMVTSIILVCTLM